MSAPHCALDLHADTLRGVIDRYKLALARLNSALESATARVLGEGDRRNADPAQGDGVDIHELAEAIVDRIDSLPYQVGPDFSDAREQSVAIVRSVLDLSLRGL